MAHQTAVLTRTHKMPKLEDLIVKEEKAKKPTQSWEQQYAIASNWVNRKKRN